MATVPDGVRVHLLPSGSVEVPRTANLRYRAVSGIAARIDAARTATAEYLAAIH
jgi:NTE family protein